MSTGPLSLKGCCIHSLSVSWPLGSAATENLEVSPGLTFFLIWGQMPMVLHSL